jgi:hypothetical protein
LQGVICTAGGEARLRPSQKSSATKVRSTRRYQSISATNFGRPAPPFLNALNRELIWVSLTGRRAASRRLTGRTWCGSPTNHRGRPNDRVRRWWRGPGR